MEQERINENTEVMLPGFRFHPTDEELVGFYLRRKIQQKPLSIELIKQLDIYKFDPWDLPKLATTGEKEWYFYCPRDRKYRNSTRPNRVTGAGFWKATGTDRPIYSSEGGSKCIGLKKSLVFYRGRAARGTKTEWMMHEFRLPSAPPNPNANNQYLDKNIPANEAWAICRIFKKANSNAQRALSLSQSCISYPPQGQNTTTNSDHVDTMNPNSAITYTYTYTTTTSNDSQHSSSLLNFQCPSNGNYIQRNAVYADVHDQEAPKISTNDASSLLLDMSTSVLGECSRESHDLGFQKLPEPYDGPISSTAALDMMQYNVGYVDGEWGLVRFPNYSNLLWDYSSPCPSELSTAYSTNNCYT